VQPFSSQANTAVFFACLKPGDKILGFDFHGGHLTRFSCKFSGRLYSPLFYGVERETGRLDYDKIQEIAIKNSQNDHQELRLIRVTWILNVLE
jgi:glycine hydroxymethyltransferase